MRKHVILFSPLGIFSNTPAGYLKLWIVLTPIYKHCETVTVNPIIEMAVKQITGRYHIQYGYTGQ
jgi:hypothetical protein